MGLRVGNYELEEELLTAGPSTFYRARNVILGSPVSVRRLTIDPARADDVRATFFREMRHAAALQHPTCWRPIDVLDADGYLWSVQDARRGTMSEDRVRELGPMTLADAARYGGELADALSYLHARGFVHGRVSPRWTLVDEQGAQLISFTKSADLAAGIWPLRDAVNGLTAFSSPEELAGGRTTSAGDLYALAGTLVFWLTGAYPRGGATPQDAFARAKAGAPLVDFRALRPDLPPVLATAIDHALAADPEQRHGSVASLGQLLVETYRRLAAEVPSGFETGVFLRPTGGMEPVQILGRHGSGAFGVVFRAKARDHDTVYAVKALKPEHRHDTDARERFLREAQALQAIDHPNVVRIRAVGEEGGTPYAVMDFVAGPDLATLLLREGAMSPCRALRIAAGVARGLEAIHLEGIVHRDLKPHNILVAPDDRPVIADFGVARSMSATRMTMTGRFVGTPAYMAPEQFDDEAPTFTVDLYALGAILHEMLAGAAPFAGRDAISTIRAIREQPPPRLPDDVPETVREVVDRLLRKEPAERYPTATAVRGVIEALQCRLEAERVPEAPHPARADAE
ncbi:MAG: protein kinase [Planctomycetia bacterium]|nr:protein kinase [Planctomycetia bacterium]